MTEPRKRGRPATGQKPTKQVTIAEDVQEALDKVADAFQSEFGFRPTYSQAIRHVLLMGKPASKITRRKDAVS